MSVSDTPSPLKASDPTEEPVRDKTWADRAQVMIAAATVAALIVTIVVACQGQVTVSHNSQVTQRQSEDAQLSAAITALGTDDTSEQIAGLLLLARNTASRFTLMSQSGEPAADVYNDYTTALQVLSGYLSSHGQSYLTGSDAPAGFGRGYGFPPSPGIPLNVIYAADQIAFLLAKNMATSVGAVSANARPAIDLSNDELFGQPWTGIDFAWISAYMVGIDLRGAFLESSQWSSSSDLSHAYLQCADLRDADFRGADLSGANLSGAYVQGADFRGADLSGTTLASLYGVARWSRQPSGLTALPGHEWDQRACLENRGFWRGQPAPEPSASSKK